MFSGQTKIISTGDRSDLSFGNVYTYEPINECFAIGKATFFQRHEHADIGTNASLEAKYKLLQANQEKIIAAAAEFFQGISAIEAMIGQVACTDPDECLAFIDRSVNEAKGRLGSAAFERLQGVAENIKREIAQVLDHQFCKEYLATLTPEEHDILLDNKEVLKLLKRDVLLFPVSGGKDAFEKLLENKRVKDAWPLLKKMSQDLYGRLIPAAIQSVISSHKKNIERISEFYGPGSIFLSLIEEFYAVLLKKQGTFSLTLKYRPDIDGILKNDRTLPLLIKEVGESLAHECRRLNSCRVFEKRVECQKDPQVLNSFFRFFNYGDEIMNVAQFIANIIDQRPVAQTTATGEAVVLFTDDLSPVEYAAISMSASGIVCSKGNTISHTAIMAKGSDISYVVNKRIQSRLLVAEGDLVLIDPLKGTITVEPNQAQLAEFYEDKKRYQREVEINDEAKSFAIGKRTYSVDKQRVEISVITNSYKDINEVVELNEKKGANIGLVRTELLTDYGQTRTLPTMEEYFMFYMKAVSAVSESIEIRTLDLNDTDKKLYRGISSEGLNGVAFDIVHPENFKAQIKAIMHCASIAPQKQISVIFPQVERTEQVVQAKALVEASVQELNAEHPGKFEQVPENMSFGIMLETMDLIVDEFRALKDILLLNWISSVKIGGNDLLCSVLKKERETVSDQDFFEYLHLRTLSAVAAFLHGQKDIRYSYCGQGASNKDRLPVLIGLGLQKFAVTTSNYYYLKQSVMYEVNVKSWRERLFSLITEDMSARQIQNLLVPPLYSEMKESYAKTVLDMLLRAKAQTRTEQSMVATQIEMNQRLMDLSAKVNQDNIILDRLLKMTSFISQDLVQGYSEQFNESDMLLVFPALLWRYSEVDSFIIDPGQGYILPSSKTSFLRKEVRNVGQKYASAEQYKQYYTSETYINSVLSSQQSYVHKNKKLNPIDKVLLSTVTPLFLGARETILDGLENGGFLKGSRGNVFLFLDARTSQVIGVCIKDVRAFAKDLTSVTEMEKIENGSVVFWKFPQEGTGVQILKYSREIDSRNMRELGRTDNNSVFPSSIDRENPYFYANISTSFADHIRMFQVLNMANKQLEDMKVKEK